MKLLLTGAMAAMAALGLYASELTGTWKGSMQTQMGNADVVIAFNPGAALAGKVSAGEYEGPIENAKLDGDKIAFEAKLQPGALVFQGTVAADQMNLNVTGTQGDKYTIVCARQK